MPWDSGLATEFWEYFKSDDLKVAYMTLLLYPDEFKSKHFRKCFGIDDGLFHPITALFTPELREDLDIHTEVLYEENPKHYDFWGMGSLISEYYEYYYAYLFNLTEYPESALLQKTFSQDLRHYQSCVPYDKDFSKTLSIIQDIIAERKNKYAE